jgi:hypothetical protein
VRIRWPGLGPGLVLGRARELELEPGLELVPELGRLQPRLELLRQRLGRVRLRFPLCIHRRQGQQLELERLQLMLAQLQPKLVLEQLQPRLELAQFQPKLELRLVLALERALHEPAPELEQPHHHTGASA